MKFLLILFLLNLNQDETQLVLTDGINHIYDISRESNIIIDNKNNSFILIVENQDSDTFGTLTQDQTVINSASWMGQYGNYLLLIPQSNRQYSIKISPLEKNISHTKVKLKLLKLDPNSDKLLQALKLYTQANDLRIKQYLGKKNHKKQALELFKKSEQLFTQLNNPFYLGLSNYEIAVLISEENNQNEAIKYFNKAIRYWKEPEYIFQKMQTQNMKGLSYWHIGSLDKALLLFKNILTDYNGILNIKLKAQALNNIGLIYWEQGQMSKAQKTYDQALNSQNINIDTLNKFNLSGLLENIKHHSNLTAIAATISNLALTYDALGNPRRSEKLLEIYLDISKSLSDKNAHARAENNISLIYLNSGRADKAIRLLNSAVKSFTKLNNKRWLALSLHNLAQVYAKLGLYRLSAINLTKAIKLRDQQNDPKGLIESKLKFLEIYRLQERFADNKTLAETSLVLAKKMDYPSGIAKIYLNNFYINIKNSNLFDAEKNINQAIKIAEHNTYKRFLSQLRVNQARLYILQNKNNSAIEVLERQRIILKQIWDSTLLNTANNLLAQTYIKIGDLAKAEITINNEIDNLNFYISSSKKAQIRSNLNQLLKETLGLYNMIVTLQNKSELGLIKTNQMLENFHAINKNISSKKSHLSEDSIDDLMITIKSKTMALENSKLSHDDKLQIQNDMIELKAQLDFSYIASENINAGVIDIKNIQQHLEPDTLVVQFSTSEAGGVSWWISHDKYESYVLPNKKALLTLVTKARLNLLSNNTSTTDIDALSQLLLSPLKNYKNTKKVLLLLDEPLNLVPFSALSDPRFAFKNPIFSSTTVKRITSIDSVLKLLNTNRIDNYRTVIIADPVTTATDERLKNLAVEDQFVKSFSRLTGTRSEARNIDKLVDAYVLQGFAASKANLLLTDLKDANIIHFATHAFFHPEISGLSSLVLSSYDKQGKQQSSFLRAIEISNMQFNNDLIVLSGCETGVGKADNSLGLGGLTQAFMQAGAKNLIASLWKVDDRVTERMMIEFYKNYSAGMNINNALWQAQKTIQSNPRTRHPKYWAGWFLLSR